MMEIIVFYIELAQLLLSGYFAIALYSVGS